MNDFHIVVAPEYVAGVFTVPELAANLARQIDGARVVTVPNVNTPGEYGKPEPEVPAKKAAPSKKAEPAETE